MTSKSLVINQPKGNLVNGVRTIKPLARGQVLVKVWFCGVCHTDIHEIDNDWNREASFYPFVPGHEIIGEITQIGESVKDRKVGDVVGVGWQSTSCGQCFACKQGWRNSCDKIAAVYEDQNGGLQQYVTSDQDFAILIPKPLQTPEAAPLLCGGITVYSPLLRHKVDLAAQTLVVGMGGLGHLAVQLLAKRGNVVSVLTRDERKKSDAQKFGSSAFYSSLDELPDKAFDFIIATAPSQFNLNLALTKLRARGNLCIVAAVPGELSFDVFNLINSDSVISSGSIGDPVDISKLLNFAAKNGVLAQTEIYQPSEANEAIKRLRNGDVRYRAVIDFRNFS